MEHKINSNFKVISDFGEEWNKFSQNSVKDTELERIFNSYFKIFPWEALDEYACGFDLGCGSGRWARFVAPKVKKLYCIDPSEKALDVARQNLKDFNNIEFIYASVDNLPIDDESMDFGYSLGVLHHVPNTQQGIKSCVEKLKLGAPFLLYLYYAFDNKPRWFQLLWKISDYFRKLISMLPFKIKYPITQCIVAVVYYPLARVALLLEKSGVKVDNFPLSAYRNRSFYVMRTDALDRFGTTLEKRFTAKEIRAMMEVAGLTKVTIGKEHPYWCVVGYKK